MLRATFALLFLATAALVATPPAADAGGGCHRSGITDDATTQVDLNGNCFEPTVVRVERDDTVTWTNRDEAVHTVSGAGNVFLSDDLGEGETYAFTFSQPGVFPYYCAYHPSMIGAVVVSDAEDATADGVASTASGDDGSGGLGLSEIAAIAGGLALAAGAVGLVGSRVLSRLRAERASA